MSEGSVVVDEGGFPTADVSESTSNEEVRDDTAQVDEQPPNEEAQTEEEKVEYTEKGTKLDPNPQSALHQQLANARRTLQQYEQVLSNPELLKRYAQQAGLTIAEAREEIVEEADALTPDRLKTVEDLTGTLNKMQSEFKREIKALRDENQALKGNLTGLSEGRRIEQVSNNLRNDVSTVREKYPELDPKSSEYDKELEEEIGRLYIDLDAVDPSDLSKGFKGNYSMADLADRIMRAARKAQKRGSQRAQTDVQVKKSGRVVSSGKQSPEKVTESKDPGTVIAQRIAKMYGSK